MLKILLLFLFSISLVSPAEAFSSEVTTRRVLPDKSIIIEYGGDKQDTHVRLYKDLIANQINRVIISGDDEEIINNVFSRLLLDFGVSEAITYICTHDSEYGIFCDTTFDDEFGTQYICFPIELPKANSTANVLRIQGKERRIPITIIINIMPGSMEAIYNDKTGTT